MKQATDRYLETAARNRDLARFLLASVPKSGANPPQLEWIAVVAFYSAVHYVGAILWEWRDLNPSTHTERTWYVDTHPPLSAFAADYRQLNSNGWSARYVPGYRLQEQDAQYLLDTALARVEETVCAALGIPPP